MTTITMKWLLWGGAAVLIAADSLFHIIPNRVFMGLLLIFIVWSIGDLNKRLEAKDVVGAKRLSKRLDEINKRLRWVEFSYLVQIATKCCRKNGLLAIASRGSTNLKASDSH